MFCEKGIEIPQHIAGLLCAAIISDTLLFRSPTCTPVDCDAAKYLAKIAGVDCEEFATAMFEAGSNMKSKTAEQIFFQDFKVYEVDKMNVGVAQISCMAKSDLDIAKSKLKEYLGKARKEQGLNMLFFMLTNIMSETTELLCEGEGAEKTVKEAFGMDVEDGSVILPNVISRKKQLIPSLLSKLQK